MPYRIGHAQKALSLVLKHLWCHQQLPDDEAPPVCPVDRMMLDAVQKGHRIAWTKIDTMDEYESALKLIRNKSGDVGLAVFELFTFSGATLDDSPAAINQAQCDFLDGDRWAKPRGVTNEDMWGGALEDALRSSHARARLYRPKTAEPDKVPFKKALRVELRRFGIAYADGSRPLTESFFKQDVQQLRTTMSANFAQIL